MEHKFIVIEDIGRNLNPIGWNLKSPIKTPSRFPLDIISRLLTESGVTKMSEVYEADHTLRVSLDYNNFRKPFEELWAEQNPGKEFPWARTGYIIGVDTPNDGKAAPIVVTQTDTTFNLGGDMIIDGFETTTDAVAAGEPLTVTSTDLTANLGNPDKFDGFTPEDTAPVAEEASADADPVAEQEPAAEEQADAVVGETEEGATEKTAEEAATDTKVQTTQQKKQRNR